ncbi:MAG: MFS transporter [Clostridia bacterium]|nr:MFS transporter [Clostridia bacterium]
MKTQQYLESKKYSSLVFIACFIAYAASYVGRINYSAALPDILEEGLFTKSQAGIIGSAFFIVYGFFQIINGFLGDKISPFKMIILGTFLSAGANTVMTFCTTNVSMAIVWGFNGFALSLLWAAILKILANIINYDMRSKACLNISATLPIGTVLAYILASVSINFFNWKYVFYTSTVVLLFSGVFFTVTYILSKKHIKEVEISTPLNNSKKSEQNKNAGKFLPLFLSAGLLLVLPADAIHGAIKEGITTWVPTMITETYNTPVAFSVFVSIILPIVNLSGNYIVTPLYNKVFKKDELKTGAAILTFVLIPFTFLIFMKNLPVVVSVILLALGTTAMHTFNYMIITLVPMQFAKYGKTATVTGVMNATAYIGCAAATYGFGIISDNIGWNGTVIVWIVIDIIALLFTSLNIKKWNRFKQNECI